MSAPLPPSVPGWYLFDREGEVIEGPRVSEWDFDCHTDDSLWPGHVDEDGTVDESYSPHGFLIFWTSPQQGLDTDNSKV